MENLVENMMSLIDNLTYKDVTQIATDIFQASFNMFKVG